MVLAKDKFNNQLTCTNDISSGSSVDFFLAPLMLTAVAYSISSLSIGDVELSF